jgi:hypothetical protein
MSIKIKKFDSLWFTITADLNDFDPVWGNWTGKWTVVSELGGAAILSGNISKLVALGEFMVQVPTTGIGSLDSGTYYCCPEISNTTIDFRKELQPQKFVVSEQNVPA